MLHAFVHSKSVFLGACVITWVTLQQYFRWWWEGGTNTYLILGFIPFLRCICSEKALFGHVRWGGGGGGGNKKRELETHTRISRVSSLLTSDSSLWFLCRWILNVSLLEHFYSHSSHWNSWSFSFFWWTFMISDHMYLANFSFYYICIHTGYTHVSPQSWSQPSHGLTTR